MEDELEMARLASNQGRYEVAIEFLKRALAHSHHARNTIPIAGAIFYTILIGLCNKHYPLPGTTEYEECRRYLKIQMDAYEHADPTIQAEFEVFEDVNKLREILARMESGEAIPNQHGEHDMSNR